MTDEQRDVRAYVAASIALDQRARRGYGLAPTKAERLRIVRAKEGPCMACLIRHDAGLLSFSAVVVGCDFHHVKSGNVRRGHRFGFALCQWHHRGYAFDGHTPVQCRALFGPSLMDGSRRFRETYGADDALIARQDLVLAESAP